MAFDETYRLKFFLITMLVVTSALGNATGVAQKLKSEIFTVCGQKLSLEIARSFDERGIGLMHRTGIPSGTGMIFVFEESELHNFWMKDVNFDIDIGYFDEKGQLRKAITMQGTSPITRDQALPRYSSEVPARFAVEVAAGFFRRHAPRLKDCRLKPLSVLKSH